MATKLSATAAAKLWSEIEEGLVHMSEAHQWTGRKLMEFEDGQGPEAMGYETLSKFLQARGSIGKSQAYRLISAARTVETISQVVKDSPRGEKFTFPEKTVRPLTTMSPDEQPKAFERAVAAAGGVEHVKAQHIRAAVRDMKPPAKKASPAKEPNVPAPDPDSLESVQADLDWAIAEIRSLSREIRQRVFRAKGDEITRPWCSRYAIASITGTLNEAARDLERNYPVGGTAKKPRTRWDEEAAAVGAKLR